MDEQPTQKSDKVRDILKISLWTLLKQRRVWAALLSAVSVIATAAGHPMFAAVCTAMAGALGIDSYIRPKTEKEQVC